MLSLISLHMFAQLSNECPNGNMFRFLFYSQSTASHLKVIFSHTRMYEHCFMVERARF